MCKSSPTAGLQCFDAHDDVVRQVVKALRAIGLGRPDAARGPAGAQPGANVGVAIVVLSRQQMEAQAVGGDELELRPAASRVDGHNVSRPDNRETLPYAGGVEVGDILTAEEEAGQFKRADRPD